MDIVVELLLTLGRVSIVVSYVSLPFFGFFVLMHRWRAGSYGGRDVATSMMLILIFWLTPIVWVIERGTQ